MINKLWLLNTGKIAYIVSAHSLRNVAERYVRTHMYYVRDSFEDAVQQVIKNYSITCIENFDVGGFCNIEIDSESELNVEIMKGEYKAID